MGSLEHLSDAELVADINALVDAVADATEGGQMPNTILMPRGSFKILSKDVEAPQRKRKRRIARKIAKRGGFMSYPMVRLKRWRAKQPAAVDELDDDLEVLHG